MTKEDYRLPMSLYERNLVNRREYTIMGDVWDYRLRKTDIAWELASRLIPDHAQNSGPWTADVFVAKAQATIKEAYEAIDAVFKESQRGPFVG